MEDLNDLPLERLFAVLTAGMLGPLLEAARREDLDEAGDVTTSCSMVDDGPAVRAAGVAREAGVVAGLAVVGPVLDAFGCPAEIRMAAADGDPCKPGEILWRLTGALGPILTAERTLLNLVGRLSGIATLTARYVQQIAGTRAAICDTRKTTPGLRPLEKYAVRCGGGFLHRLGLYDAMLLKDNHLAHLGPGELAPAVIRAAAAARARHDLRFVEVEADTLDQVEILLTCPPGTIDMILLDNMPPEAMREAVARRDRAASPVLLEASGGVSLRTVRAVAQTGVDRISVGALTRAAPWLDVGLDVT